MWDRPKEENMAKGMEQYFSAYKDSDFQPGGCLFPQHNYPVTRTDGKVMLDHMRQNEGLTIYY